MKQKSPEPNFTQIPNCILDNMSEYTDAELRVVMCVARQTVGWHSKSIKLTLDQIGKMTGMTRNGCFNAVKTLVGEGIVIRRPVGKIFSYELAIESSNAVGCENGASSKRVGCDHPTPLTAHNKEKETNNAPASPVPPVFKVKTESLKRLFTDRWCSEFKASTGTAYLFGGAKDGQAADRVLKAGFNLDEFFAVARAAWKQTDEKSAWWCVTQSRSLATFVGGWNKIKGEIDLMKKRSNQPTTIAPSRPMQSQPGGGSNGRF